MSERRSAIAWALLGDWFWMMTSAAGAPPMPPLPRIMVLPSEYLTWAHQDILFFQPLLAVEAGNGTPVTESTAVCPVPVSKK